MNTLPNARTADIIEQEADRELLIYDLRTNKMFQLNETSKRVYKACGKLSFDEVKRRYRFPDDLIRLALDDLRRNNLLEDSAGDYLGGVTRREVIKRVGLSTMLALPLITSLLAPQSAHAASQSFAAGSRNVNESCNTSTDCNAASAPNCVAVRGQSNTGRACCIGTARPTFLPGGDPNGGAVVNYESQAVCENAVSPQCCSRRATCSCIPRGNNSASCSAVCR